MSMHIYFHWLILCVFICDYQMINTVLLIEAELRIICSIMTIAPGFSELQIMKLYVRVSTKAHT